MSRMDTYVCKTHYKIRISGPVTVFVHYGFLSVFTAGTGASNSIIGIGQVVRVGQDEIIGKERAGYKRS